MTLSNGFAAAPEDEDTIRRKAKVLTNHTEMSKSFFRNILKAEPHFFATPAYIWEDKTKLTLSIFDNLRENVLMKTQAENPAPSGSMMDNIISQPENQKAFYI